jgi:hypothetical protein
MSKRTRRLIATAAVAASGLAAAVVSLAGTASAAAGCAVDYAVSSQWSGGFVAAVSVRNLGDPVADWRLTWSYGAGQQITSAWEATVTQNADQVTATGAGHNADLAAGAGASFGLQGTWSGSNPAPGDFAVNGVACTSAAQPPGTTGPTTPPTTAPTVTPTVTPPVTPPVQPADCPASGNITYTLTRAANPTADQTSAYDLITRAMNEALAIYNCQTGITKALRVSYDPGVATADANYNGNVRFGARSSMQRITAMHEIGHTLGVGTVSAWSARLSNGVWTGAAANAELRALTGDPAAEIHGDGQHFWPYGLNYTSEVKSDADLVIHCKLVVALRRDMGLQ